jgi:hypothetical protein
MARDTGTCALVESLTNWSSGKSENAVTLRNSSELINH